MKNLAAFIMITGLVAGDVNGEAKSKTDVAFESVAEEFLEYLLRSSPVWATGLGDHRYDALIEDVNADARDRDLKSAKAFLSALEAMDLGNLTRENQVDYHLLRHRLQTTAWNLETFREWEWNPLIYAGLAGDSIYGLLARESDELPARLRSAGARLKQFPRLFTQIRAALTPRRVPSIHAKTAVDQNRGLNEILDDLLVPHLDVLPKGERQEVEEAVKVAQEAIAEHQTWLENELLPNAKGRPQLGAERYAQKFAHELFTTVTSAQLRERAERQLADLHDRMYQISLEVLRERASKEAPPAAPSSEEKRALIQSCLEIAYADRPSRDGVVQAAEHSLTMTTDFVREHGIISLPPDPVEIIVMPEFRRGVSLAYCDSPGALDVGKKTFYAVAPPPSDWTDDQVDSLLREYNRRSLHVLTIHEAMPGHFVQLALANRFPGRLRAVLGSGSFIEGWAVYCEWMMCEQGFLQEDPLMRLVTLKWYLRDVTNALLDQMVHIDGIERDEAVRFLMEQAFQEESEASNKFTRALLTSGQLATYFTGYLEHADLRKAVEEHLGPRFNLKAYHDRVVSFGSPPVRYVRALMLDEAIPE